jgi:hypothetical protein
MSSILDFDSCSRAWRANKKRVGESYTYICASALCKRGVCKDAYGMIASLFCARHRGLETKQETFLRVEAAIRAHHQSFPAGSVAEILESGTATGNSKDDEESIAERVKLRKRN